ncbi:MULTISPECIES: HTTM domain-containing protein [Streptomyces]|uniref:HTTM domain-containing protein n=1 Tax=Streptomyces TaxID=1883 RepID=UPI0036508991
MSNFMATVDRWSIRPVSVLGASGTRCLLGFVGFMYYASQYADRRYLFGPDGVLPHRDFTEQIAGTFNLYAWSDSSAWSEILFHAGALAALAVMLGIGGRVGLAVHWALLWSVYQRQPALLDGGDNLAYVVIPMLLLTRCYDRFSLSVGLVDRLKTRLPGAVRALSTPLHNLGVLAIAAQISLVYVVSGLYKVMGDVWQDGTALFYIMRVPEFELPGVSSLVYGNDWLVYLGTYATVLFMVYFPLGILIPVLRPWTAVMSIGFHISIAVFMGLTGFALTMVACDLVFLSASLDRALSWVQLVRRRAAHQWRATRAGVTAADTAALSAPEAEGVPR